MTHFAPGSIARNKVSGTKLELVTGGALLDSSYNSLRVLLLSI
jgi:hypothetical protein